MSDYQESNNDNYNTIYNLSREGHQLLKQGRLDEAEGRFKSILTIDDHNSYALAGLGDIERKKNNYKNPRKNVSPHLFLLLKKLKRRTHLKFFNGNY